MVCGVQGQGFKVEVELLVCQSEHRHIVRVCQCVSKPSFYYGSTSNVGIQGEPLRTRKLFSHFLYPRPRKFKNQYLYSVCMMFTSREKERSYNFVFHFHFHGQISSLCNLCRNF